MSRLQATTSLWNYELFFLFPLVILVGLVVIEDWLFVREPRERFEKMIDDYIERRWSYSVS